MNAFKTPIALFAPPCLQCIHRRGVAVLRNIGQAFSDAGAHAASRVVSPNHLGAGGVCRFLHGLADAALLIRIRLACRVGLRKHVQNFVCIGSNLGYGCDHLTYSRQVANVIR